VKSDHNQYIQVSVHLQHRLVTAARRQLEACPFQHGTASQEPGSC